MPRKQEDYSLVLPRLYHAYIERGLKGTQEFQSEGKVTLPTLESVVEASRMGNQNEVIKETLREYVIENEGSLLSIPTMDAEKQALVSAKRRRLAILVGRIKAKLKRGEEVPRARIVIDGKTFSRLKAESTRLNNFIRLSPFLAVLDREEITKLERLPYSISRPRVKKTGQFTVRYRGETQELKQLLKALS